MLAQRAGPHDRNTNVNIFRLGGGPLCRMDSAQLGRDSVEAYLFVGNLNSLSDQTR